VVLGAQEIKFVRRLLGDLGRPELVALCEQGPGPHQQPVIAFLQQTFRTRTRAEWLAWFDGRDVSFAPVNTLLEALQDPQVVARQMVLTDAQGHRHLGVPIKFSDEPAQPRLTIPTLGAHGDDIRGELVDRRSAADSSVSN
jgi:crotonobetainyl-CoA:carnitine CoA-transferase CaiB-like acyl-CoA transferase